MISPTTLTAPKTAKRLGCSGTTLRRLIDRGVVAAVRTDAGHLVASSEIDRVRQLPGWGIVCPSEIAAQ